MAENNKLICSNCRNELPQDSEFCQYCGSKIATEKAATVNLQLTTKTNESLKKNDTSAKMILEGELESNIVTDEKEQPVVTAYTSLNHKEIQTNSILKQKNRDHCENQNVDFALTQAFIHLKVNAWKKALSLFDSIIVQSPYCAQAYIGKLMAELKICDEKDLVYAPKALTEYYSFNMALEVADNDYKSKLLQIEKSREFNSDAFYQKSDIRSFVSKIVIFVFSLFGLFCEIALLSISFDEVTGAPTLLLGVAVISLITLIFWIIYVLCCYGKRSKKFVFFPTLLTVFSYPLFILNSVISNAPVGTYIEAGKMLHDYFPRNIFPLQAIAGSMILIIAVLFITSKGHTTLKHKLLVLIAAITTVFSYNIEMFSNSDILLINGIFLIPLVILVIYIFACSNTYISFPRRRILKQKGKYLQSTYNWAVNEANENNLQSINLAIRLFSTILSHRNSDNSLSHCYQKREIIKQKLKANENKRTFLNSIIGICVCAVIIFTTSVIPLLCANIQYSSQNYINAYYSYNYSFIPYSNDKFMESSYQYATELFENKEYEAAEKVLANIPTSYKETEKYNYYITAMHHLNSRYWADHDPCMAYEYIDYCITNYDGFGDSEDLMKSNYYLSSLNKMQGEWYFLEEKEGVGSTSGLYIFKICFPDFETKTFKIFGSKFEGKQIISEYGNGYRAGEKDNQLFYIEDISDTSFEFDGKDTIVVAGRLCFKKK